MRTRSIWVVVALALCGLGGFAPGAHGYRPLVSEAVLATEPGGSSPPPDGQVEGICGLASAGSTLYVSEYYRHRVDLFNSGSFAGQVSAPNPLDGVCGLAGGAGTIYANEWHESVLRLLPGVQVFDAGHESTGVAVDAAGNVYADDRTYVAVYEPSGAPLLREGQPLKIGLGSLREGFGVAVAGGRVYVADAADENVKVYEPAGDPSTPVAVIDAGFTSLVDSALAVDPVSGHLVVLDNLQPGFESPEAAIAEFEADGTLLDSITHGIVHGAPSGLAFDASGDLFVSSGNTEDSNVFEFGPYATSPPGLAGSQSRIPVDPGAAAEAPSGAAADGPPARTAASASEVIQRGGVRVAVKADLSPRRLPRTSPSGVRLAFSAKIAAVNGSVPPQLRRIGIEINRNGHINPAGLPVCELSQIQPSTTTGALEACRSSLIGEGTFSARVLLSQQAPFPSAGKVVAFNGTWRGRPAILAHVFGTQPVPTSYTLPFVIGSVDKGAYGTELTASLPRFTSKWGYVTGITLDLGRSFSTHGRRRNYLSAACPAPKGFTVAAFPLSRASLGFAGGREISQTLTRSCKVRG
ncbi:MAG TPA: hypothetical protein VFP21_06375 [Solirubrobacterales bacterium]|nr:hypothetical protein [Solirubrobacterales bacterium]